MKILYKLPSRSREDKCFDAIDNIIEMSVTEEYKIMLTLDADDPIMANAKVLDRIRSYGDTVVHYYGFSYSKINSINRDIFIAPDYDILIAHADDMHIVVKGFDSFIVEDMTQHFPDTDGLLHYPDGSPAKDKLITWPVIGKKYLQRFGYIYHGSYNSVFADNEQGEVAKRLHKYKFINRQLVDHRHPVWKKSEWDELYRRNEEPIKYQMDRENYLKRAEINFDL